MTQSIVILSGAGMSAESGINTFRDADGLWEGHDVMEVASPQGWQNNPALVLDFYNQRRRQLLQVKPNQGHMSLVELAQHFNVDIVTQNVDNLHEAAGSDNVLHLHGELLKAQSSADTQLTYACHDDINLGDKCELGSQLRPAIVWFGEMVPALEEAAQRVEQADIVIVVGTSMQVYPAASLVLYANNASAIYYVDPNPNVSDVFDRIGHLNVIKDTAANGLPKLVEQLITDK